MSEIEQYEGIVWLVRCPVCNVKFLSAMPGDPHPEMACVHCWKVRAISLGWQLERPFPVLHSEAGRQDDLVSAA